MWSFGKKVKELDRTKLIAYHFVIILSRLDLTTLTVLSIMCIALPVIHASVNKDLKVDITIHIPKGFIKPGIQVFFNTETGGKVDVEDWTDPLNVSSYGKRVIHLQRLSYGRL